MERECDCLPPCVKITVDQPGTAGVLPRGPRQFAASALSREGIALGKTEVHISLLLVSGCFYIFCALPLSPPKGKNFKKTSSETFKHAGAIWGLSNTHSELEAISATPVSVFANIFFRVLLLQNKDWWSKEGSLQENFAPCDLLIIHHLSLDLLKPAQLSPDLSTVPPAPASNIHFPFSLASSLGCCPV